MTYNSLLFNLNIIMKKFSESKKIVRNYLEELENVDENTILTVIEKYTDKKSYSWKGYWPYREEIDAKTCVEKFWKPFLTSFKHLQRRQDLFFGKKFEFIIQQNFYFTQCHR